MVVGLGTPSLAMDNDATMQEFDDINAYNEVTVFTETMGRALSMTLQERVEEAKAGIMALDLENQGLSYIQEACLTELDSIAQMDGNFTRIFCTSPYRTSCNSNLLWHRSWNRFLFFPNQQKNY